MYMKTVVKIDPEKEYQHAKNILKSLSFNDSLDSDVSSLGGSVDNLKTVIDVLLERATPKKKSPVENRKPRSKNPKKNRESFDKLPSQRYPDLEVHEEIIASETPPICPCCSEEMKESGIYKVSEKMEVIPKQYYIARNKRIIYNCGSCHGNMQNAPAKPSISQNSNYGDSFMLDVVLSKYCDLIPIDRYSAIADRAGVQGLPPHSLIGLTHQVAFFLKEIYKAIKQEILDSEVILADETPHKMLEGDSTPNWYLWGFSSLKGCVFEAHGTRSGTVPLDFLADSCANYLVTDGYSGYKRALKELRQEGREMTEVHCNAHAFRYFRDASTTWEKDTEIFLSFYGKIYQLERDAENDDDKVVARKNMIPLFEGMKIEAQKTLKTAMPKSALEKSLNYFLNHYSGLTECLGNIDVPLDNNFSENLLRSYVVGRKTWYGTHSKKGAKTGAILFSLVESCKINKLNPRKYFDWIVQQIHFGAPLQTPYEYMQKIKSG